MAQTRKNRKSGGGTRKASKTAAAVKRLPRKAATTRLIKQVINRKVETKYVSNQVGSGGSVVDGFCIPANDAITILPKVPFQTNADGAESNLREGDQIEPLRANVRGHLWFNPLQTVQGSSKIIFVKMFIVQSKSVKDESLKAQLNPGWLESGANDPVSWVSTALDFQAFFPVCKKNYTVLKTQTFKFVKNVGICIADSTSGNSPNIDMDRKTFSYSWKPPMLKYANTAANQPSNHYPMMFLVAYAPGLDVEATEELQNAILYDFNTEMYYKDP